MKASVAQIMITKLRRLSHSLVSSPTSSAGMPRTIRILAVLDPTTLPSASPGTPLMIASTEIRSSGAEVPKATMVRLTISAGMPSRRLRFTAPRTSVSPASRRITRPSPAMRNSVSSTQERPLSQVGQRPPVTLMRPHLGQVRGLGRLPRLRRSPRRRARTGPAQAPEHGQHRHADQEEGDDLDDHVTARTAPRRRDPPPGQARRR